MCVARAAALANAGMASIAKSTGQAPGPQRWRLDGRVKLYFNGRGTAVWGLELWKLPCHGDAVLRRGLLLQDAVRLMGRGWGVLQRARRIY